MNRSFRVILLAAVISVGSSGCASLSSPQAVDIYDESSSTAFSTALSSAKASATQPFIGRNVMVIGGRPESKPEGMEIVVLDARDRKWTVLVLRPSVLFPAGREVRTVEHWNAFFIVTRVVGVVRSIDTEHRRIVIQPQRAIIGMSM